MITHQNTQSQKLTRVVVLGANGFIGKVICSKIEAQGIPTIALTSAEIDLSEANAVERLVDIFKPSDSVVMLAALTPDKGRDIATLMKNLIMMQSLCTALEKTGCTHLIYFSSDAVYNNSVSRINEDIPASPQDLYGVMHYTREIMAHSLANVPVLVLRPTIVYGLDDTHNSYGPNRFRRMAQKEGKITLFGGGEETRDHIHVDDIALLTLRCLLSRSTGTLNVATGTSKSFHEVAELVAMQFNREIEIVVTPRQNPVTHRHYDVNNLIKAFPDFCFTCAEDGVERVHKESGEAF